MKTMIRSFASALVAVMTLGLVQTAQAEPCSIEQLVEPEGACTITQDKTQAEGGEEVKFTLSNIKEGYQVEDVKVFLYGEGGEIYPDYNYEEDYYSFNMPEENVYIYVRCVKPTTEYSIDIPTFPGGNVSGPSSAEEGAPVTLTVTPDKGYELTSIVVVGDGVTINPEKGEGSTYTFTMPPSAVEVQATFKEAATKYNIAISKSIEHGTVTSNVAATNEGATVTLTVTPDAGCKLASILVEGDLATIVPEGEGSTYTFKMPACAVTVSATFKEQRAPYDGVIAIPGTLQAENYDKGGEGVAYHDTDKYNEGGVYREDDVDIEAANGGYAVAWTADEEWLEYTVNVAEGGEYDISAYLAHLDSSPSITLSVDGTNVVTLTATEPTHSWIQYAEVVGKATLTAGDHIVRIANIVGNIDWVKFTKAATKYSITIPKFENGTVTSNVASTNEGATVTLTVTPDEGYVLDTIKVDGIDPEKGEGSTYTFEMPAADVTVTATFKEAATKYSITTLADPEGTCEFEVYPVEMEAPEGDWVDFRFNLADGANFVSLTVYNTDDPTQTISEEDIGTYVDENGDEWHYFEMPDYDVTIKVTTESGGTPSATAHKISTSVTPSEACEVHAQDSAQFGEEVYFEVGNFAAGATLGSLTVWNMSAGEQVKCEQTGKGYIFTMPDGDVLIEVVCSDPEPTTKYSITTEVDPANACVITPSKTEAEGADIVTFTLSEFMSGQEIDYVVVRSLDGSAEFQPKYNEEMNEYWFNMPYYDVVIFVHCTSFAPDPGSGHKISTDVTPSGACEVHAQESAQFGEEVYFEVGNFAAGATLGSLTVWNMSAGEQVKVEQAGKGYIFTMPDGDVLIEVVCSDPAPTTTVAVIPYAADNTSVGGVYTNGIAIASTAEGTYIVDLNATVDVVFDADAGYFFKKDGAYTPVMTNTTTAAADPTEVFGPTPNQGTQVGTSAYAFVDGATCTIIGSGTADTRLSTVVSPSTITSVVIQPGITEVGARFFKDFKWLNAVTGGQDLKTVGEKAFYKCLSLETIDLDCTAVPTGLDGAVVYQNALKPDGTIYQIPNIKVKNHVATLYGKENLDDDWECLGPAEGAIIYDQGIYRFFQTRLVPEE